MSILGTAGRVASGLSSFGQSEPISRMTGAGETGDPSQPQFDTQSDNPALAAALQRIQQGSQYGTYGEGAISQAVKEFKGLEDQLQQGKLSQKDYTSIASSLQSQVNPYITSLLGGGSASASAGKAAGAQDLQSKYFRNADIYQSAQQMLGRDLTSDEFAQLAPLFGSGSDKEVEAGRAALAQMAESDKKSPTGVASKYQAGASGYNDQVNGVFQSLLSRGATQDELNHFGTMLASGQVDPYTLGQFVQQLPEYQTNQANAAADKQTQADTAARTQLASDLQGYDQNFFDKAKEGVISRYTQAGIQNSPSLDFALTNLMGNIQQQRSAYLADIARQDYVSERGNTRQDYLNNADLARQDYTQSLNQMLSNQNANTQRSNNLTDMLNNRAFNVADYQTQQNDLANLLSQQQQSSGRPGLVSTVGGLVGAGIGGYLSKTPQGATAGYQIGSGAGGLYSYL